MDYIVDNLRKDEKLIARVKISWLTLVFPALIFLVMVVIAAKATSNMDNSGFFWFLIIAGAIPFVRQLCVNLTTHLAVTNKRLVGKVGVIRVNTIDYPIEKVDNISYNASVLGNIFHYYTVSVGSAGENKRKIKGIVNALEFKNKVLDAIEQHADEARKEQAREIAAAMSQR